MGELAATSGKERCMFVVKAVRHFSCCLHALHLQHVPCCPRAELIASLAHTFALPRTPFLGLLCTYLHHSLRRRTPSRPYELSYNATVQSFRPPGLARVLSVREKK